MNKELRDKFAQEIENLTLDQITERLSAMDKEVRESQDADAVNVLTEKKEMLLERKKDLEDLEERKRKALELSGGAKGQKREKGGKEKMERTFAVDTKEYREAFFKNLMGKNLDAEERAAISASAAIPTETMNMIIHELEGAPLLNRITILNIPGNVSIPKEDTVNDANWADMGAASTDSDDSLGSLDLAAYKLIKTVEIGADTEAMSIPEFEQWLVSRLVDKMQVALQTAVINGTGSKQPTGICKNGAIASGQVTTYTKAALKYTDITKIMGLLPAVHHARASWSMPATTFFNEVLGMVDQNGKPIVVQDIANGGGYMLMGRPVDLVDSKADTIVFGSFKKYYVNFAKAIEIKSDGSVAFRTGGTVYRALALADVGVGDEKAFVVATKATA